MKDLLRQICSHSLIYDEPSSLKIYSFDQGEVPPALRKALMPNTQPDLAIQPGSIDDLAGCIRFGLDKGIPLVPRGAATFGLGGAVAHHGGILLDFSTRREIYEFDPAREMIRVGAGCRWSDVSQHLQHKGFDLCTYPTSWFSTVGGWASTGGCGIGCTKYGSFHDLIRSITVVTASGEKKELTSFNPEMKNFLGTEGQMGAIWDVTFRVRKKPESQIPFILLFDSPDAALECAQELLAEFQPYHLKFLDASRIHEINHLLHEEHPNLPKGKDLIEKDSLLVCFDVVARASSPQEVAQASCPQSSSSADRKSALPDAFRTWIKQKALFGVSDYRANLLWRERMFPLRVKRIAPGLLASELIMPQKNIAPYIRKATALGAQFGVELASECYFLNDGTALTLPVYTFRSQSVIDEALKSSLAYVLTQAGIRMGGRPYGIGIWNTPFLKQKFGNHLNALHSYKRNTDQHGLFNPGKFFELQFRTNWMGKLAALPLQSWAIPFWTSLNPMLASLLTKKHSYGARPSDLIMENEELCSKCGSCISVCPAYIDTQDERTTARGKLQLGKLILQGGTLSKEEANVLFLCMHCGACTDVCQSRLDLVPVWDELERRVEAQFGKDTERVEAFFRSVESKKIMGVPYARGAQILDSRKSE